ncbi:photoreceptor-specific nuclear receptor-like [Pollicipes pollicipes]|uniref:photoreceptor-specific nuclear receptor-like n=1 Tax=Pollicipes pollicipes TaxID=41117 RepID=UPI0018855CE3|nr:photoreceptor-specific nuclear receptor-like [Pollicipes pollicipes]
MEDRRAELTCRVCGDKASGKHYGVPSCDGCRGFFKRSIRRCRQNLEYVCKESGRCVVDVARRNQCQACRFSKCLNVNMRREAVQHERAPRSCVKRQPSLLPPEGTTPLLLSGPAFAPFAPYPGPFPAFRPFPLVPPPFLGSYAEEEEVSSSQIDVVRVDDSPAPEQPTASAEEGRLAAGPCLTADRRPSDELHPATSRPSEAALETAAKLLFLAVRWAHTIPSFIQMSRLEQSALLEASWSELFVISAAQWPLVIDSPSELAAACGPRLQPELERQLAGLIDIIQRFADLKVDHTEYACLRALVLFKPEVKSVRDPKYIEILQDQTHLMLYEYVFSQKMAAKARFGRLLLLLSSLRTVSGTFLQEVFFKRALGGVPISQLLADLNGSSTAI